MKKTVAALVLASLAGAVLAQQLKPEEMIKTRKANFTVMSWNMGKIKANLDGNFDKDQVEAAVANVRKSLGPVNVLFNHAGTIVIKPFLETEEADWDFLFDVNVKSMYLMTRAVLPMMLEQGKGAIVCTSSISAVYATPNEVLYDATKGACHMFARAIAVEFRDRGIRCNAVCPGFIETPHGKREVEQLSALGVDVSDAALKAAQGRFGQPEDIARAALYLASDDAEFVNGTQLFVDNCFSAV